MLKKFFKNKKLKKGAALVEYALLIGGVALISAGAVSLFGHKTSDMIALVAAILPGAHLGDNGPIVSGHLIETTNAQSGPVSLDFSTIASSADQGVDRLGLNVGGTAESGNGVDGLIVESR